MAAAITVRVLGPIEATGSAGQAALGGAKQRLVLVMLALADGRLVPTDRLVDAVWGEQASASARRTLQVYVSTLRKALARAGIEGETLVRDGSGYRLALPPDAFDHIRFGRLLHDGQAQLAFGKPRAAARALREALELWRGPALGDLADDVAVAGEALRLEELRSVCVEERIEADLELGGHAELVAELEQLVAQNRLRERLRGQLMLALYRSGRQAEALEVYHATRDVLVEELGLEPGPQIQELHHQILNQDEALVAPARQEGLPTIRTPRVANAFIGRERELGVVGEILKGEKTRLLTLTGPGGTGKTRLAIEASTRAAMERSVDVYWVPLAPLRDPSLVNRTVAQSFGVAEVAGTPVIETLATSQANSSALVLFDNCEHLVDPVADVASILVDACPGLTIVATSRERLGLRSEHVFAVPTMELEESEALFHARASAARADFAPDLHVAEICRALDGLPLAIELAAARTRSLSPQSIRDRLSKRLALLTSRDRDVEERQRTLEATIAWSYDLLDPLEQRVFRALSVFSGGCTLDAAEALGQADLELLESLLDKSLIRHRVDEAGQDRYWMLETIRDFAALRLAEAGEEEEMTAAHGAFYLERAKALRTDMGSTLSGSEIKLFEADRANYRVVTLDSIAEGDGDRAIEIAASLGRIWWNVGEIADSYAIVRAALELDGGTDRARVQVLCTASDFAISLGDLDEANRFLEEASERATLTDDPVPNYQVLDSRAWLSLLSGDYVRAVDFAEQAAQLGKLLSPADELHALTIMVQGMRAAAIDPEGELDREALERCVLINRELVERVSDRDPERAIFYNELGQISLALSQYSDALYYQQQSLRIEREIGRRWTAENILTIGIITGRLGNHVTGLQLTSAAQQRLDREGRALDHDPFDALQIQQVDADAIAALGEDGYAAAVSAGRELTWAEATELALGVTASDI